MRSVPLVVAAVAAAIAALVVGCSSPPPEVASIPVRYFEAVVGGDCAALGRLSGGAVAQKLREHGCEGVLTSYRQHDFRLLRVLATERDGRNPKAFMITAALSVEGKEQTAILRVENQDDRWLLVSL